MTIVYEYEVINEDLVCMITNALGVFDDYETTKEFFIREAEKRNLIEGKFLDKKKGEKGLFIIANEQHSLLFLNLKLLKQLQDEKRERDKELEKKENEK